MMKHISIIFCLLISSPVLPGQNILDLVNPFIGTGGHGHTFPGATAPFGMMQLSPDTRLTGWDGCSGYHYTDSLVYGFSHTHLSGTGVSDYGDLLVMPYTGDANFNNGADGTEGYRSTFSKENEVASPGYYATYLEKPEVQVELTTSERAGLHRYQYQDTFDQGLIIDLIHRDKVTAAYIEKVSDTELVGYRHSDAWATDQRFFFVMKFDQPISEWLLRNDEEHSSELKATGQALQAAIKFKNDSRVVQVRVGMSAVDIEGARKNLSSEIPDFNFEKVKAATEKKWKAALSKIKIKDKNNDKKTIFYTALYHTMIAPNLYSDVDGRYRGTDMGIHQTQDHDQYTIFSLWDTYRATHPLYTLIEQARTNDFINTFINQYNQGGTLPMWELAANYTGCMIGYHAVPVISDAYMKGIRNYDTELALQAMISSANANKLGIPEYVKNGILMAEQESECVSKTLEYAYDDWTIARMAEAMGKTELGELYYTRAQNYKNLYDPATGFMRARSNNRWFYPFDPAEVNFNYTEANAWQYSYYVPQDVEGWINLTGGPDQAEQKLDELFSAPQNTSGRHQADITGLIGQYAHGNEPSHHIAYMYNYLGKPYKSQAKVRQIMNELYHNAPDGLSGNEDCGQMSAWLVMSAMGFYPVAPGSNDYLIGSPWFDLVQVQLENGNAITIETADNSEENIYIQELYDGESFYDKSYLSHELLMEGPYLYFQMGATPQKDYGKIKSSRPPSSIPTKELCALPALSTGERSFRKKTMATLECVTEGATIHYILNKGKTVTYTRPIEITADASLTVWSAKENCIPSAAITSHFTKMNEDKELQLETQYASHYSAGGDLALIDRLRGGDDYRSGLWQGYEGVDLVAVIDLGKKKKVKEIRTGFLQDENSWIFMPMNLKVYTGREGDWNLYGTLENNQITPKDKGTIIKDFVVKGNDATRYLKIIAENRGICPEYHKGAGNKCWIFSDEIIIK